MSCGKISVSMRRQTNKCIPRNRVNHTFTSGNYMYTSQNLYINNKYKLFKHIYTPTTSLEEDFLLIYPNIENV